jgi:hypothetical protein
MRAARQKLPDPGTLWPDWFTASGDKLLNARDFLFLTRWPAACKQDLAQPSFRGG